MTRYRWGPRRGDADRIRRHLERQHDVPEGYVKLVRADLTYEVVRVGHLAEGEGEPSGRDG